MKIVTKDPGTAMDERQRMLSATPTVGKAFLIAGVALLFGLALLVSIIRRLIEGQAFGVNQWVFVLVTVALLVGAALLGRRIPPAIKLERKGETIDGRILSAWQEKDDEGDRHYFVAFEAGGYTFKQQINMKRFNAYSSGERVSVRQCPDEPSIARIEV